MVSGGRFAFGLVLAFEAGANSAEGPAPLGDPIPHGSASSGMGLAQSLRILRITAGISSWPRL
jgi:hypothetical protein